MYKWLPSGPSKLPKFLSDNREVKWSRYDKWAAGDNPEQVTNGFYNTSSCQDLCTACIDTITLVVHIYCIGSSRREGTGEELVVPASVASCWKCSQVSTNKRYLDYLMI